MNALFLLPLAIVGATVPSTYDHDSTTLLQTSLTKIYSNSSNGDIDSPKASCAENLYYGNGDIDSLSDVQDESECQQYCYSKGDCGIFMYDPVSKVCYRKCHMCIDCYASVNGPTQAPVPSTAALSGPRSCPTYVQYNANGERCQTGLDGCAHAYKMAARDATACTSICDTVTTYKDCVDREAARPGHGACNTEDVLNEEWLNKAILAKVYAKQAVEQEEEQYMELCNFTFR